MDNQVLLRTAMQRIVQERLIPQGFTAEHWSPIFDRLSALKIDDNPPDMIGYHGKRMIIAAGAGLITPSALLIIVEDDDLLRACAADCVAWANERLRAHGLLAV